MSCNRIFHQAWYIICFLSPIHPPMHASMHLSMRSHVYACTCTSTCMRDMTAAADRETESTNTAKARHGCRGALLAAGPWTAMGFISEDRFYTPPPPPRGGSLYRSFCLSSSTFAVSEIVSRRRWCKESLFPLLESLYKITYARTKP